VGLALISEDDERKVERIFQHDDPATLPSAPGAGCTCSAITAGHW
jgi:hypothetical protein